ncbi:hypothetical protein J2Y41_000944 [Arthrobacter sp. 1088]|nr:hypothetical protein [Arthrobacter sp. 1088]
MRIPTFLALTGVVQDQNILDVPELGLDTSPCEGPTGEGSLPFQWTRMPVSCASRR